MTVTNALELAHWRRLTAEMYAAVRGATEENANEIWMQFRETRDRLFASLPQSPLDEQGKRAFRALRYFPFNPRLRFTVPLLPLSMRPDGEGDQERTSRTFELPEGRLNCRAFGRVEFRPANSGSLRLTLYWVEGYGGGLFLPFKDETSGHETYGGGRYLYDTIKGADLGAGPSHVVLDFNYAYNPSCAYDSRWICPLAPGENVLPLRIDAGELAFEGPIEPTGGHSARWQI